VTKPRITYGSVQTRRWLGFEAWQCAHSAVPAPVTVRHPRWTCTHAAFRALVMPNSGRCSLAWLSADPYIPVAVTIATAPSSLSRGTRNADSVCVWRDPDRHPSPYESGSADPR
jgi:hypothetical protein